MNKSFFLVLLSLTHWCASDEGDGRDQIMEATTESGVSIDTTDEEEMMRELQRRRDQLKNLVKASSLPLLVLGLTEEALGKADEKEEEEKTSLPQEEEPSTVKPMEAQEASSSAGSLSGGKPMEEREASWQFLSGSEVAFTHGREEERPEGAPEEAAANHTHATKDAAHMSNDSGSSSPPSRRRCQHDTPRTVGFSLVRASSVSLRGDHSGKISFEHVLVDLNCLWRPRASVFRCKESGLYYFSFNARGRADKQAENGQTAWLVSLMLNGAEAASIGGGIESSGSSNSLLLPLNYNDEVWLQLMRGRLEEAAGFTTFSGYRVGSISPQDITGAGTLDDNNSPRQLGGEEKEEPDDETRRHQATLLDWSEVGRGKYGQGHGATDPLESVRFRPKSPPSLLNGVLEKRFSIYRPRHSNKRPIFYSAGGLRRPDEEDDDNKEEEEEDDDDFSLSYYDWPRRPASPSEGPSRPSSYRPRRRHGHFPEEGGRVVDRFSVTRRPYTSLRDAARRPGPIVTMRQRKG